MKVAVWDTYVRRTDGRLMHFDIVVPEHEKNERTIYRYGNEYLITKHILSATLTTNQCTFCHIEDATDTVRRDIETKGYHIVQIENCE